VPSRGGTVISRPINHHSPDEQVLAALDEVIAVVRSKNSAYVVGVETVEGKRTNGDAANWSEVS
jgi:hypothetical protein